MIECIFTLDYEIYGNGEGSLKELIYDPAQTLIHIFEKYDKRFVVFVEAAELDKIQEVNGDATISKIREQIQEFHSKGFEIGLHLHPQWYNADYENGRWLLDYSEYNLCTLPRERIVQIVDRAIDYLRDVLGVSDFIPLSFRAGNWLFQPAETAAKVLAERGIKVDSSVFKGGLQHLHKLDYRRALRNGDYWTFTECSDVHDPDGILLEMPIYTHMVPFWKMITSKRLGMQQKGSSSQNNRKKKFYRLLDFLRFRQPLKLDFCRMTTTELTHMMDAVIRKDEKTPELYKPIVAIGHTKDLVDFDTVEFFLSYLNTKGIEPATFEKAYKRCLDSLSEGKQNEGNTNSY